MKTICIFLLLATLLPSPAQTATPMTSHEAVTELSRNVERTVNPEAALTKSAGPDRETERSYDLTKNIVIRRKESGTVEKLPFLALPVLFQRNSTELLDAGSETNLKQLADALKSITSREPSVRFQIEGHASKDGQDADNLKLSEDRALAISRLLVQEYQVNATLLTNKGYGEAHAKAPENSPESLLEKDRVVRVVKVN